MMVRLVLRQIESLEYKAVFNVNLLSDKNKWPTINIDMGQHIMDLNDYLS